MRQEKKDVGDQWMKHLWIYAITWCLILYKSQQRCSVMLNHSSSDCCQWLVGSAYHSLKLLATKSVATPNALDGRGCLDQPYRTGQDEGLTDKEVSTCVKILVQLSWWNCTISFNIFIHKAKNGQWKKGEGKVYCRLQPIHLKVWSVKLLPPLCAARSVGPQVKFNQLWLGDQDVTRFHGFHAENLALFLHSTPRTSLRDVSKHIQNIAQSNCK